MLMSASSFAIFSSWRWRLLVSCSSINCSLDLYNDLYLRLLDANCSGDSNAASNVDASSKADVGDEHDDDGVYDDGDDNDDDDVDLLNTCFDELESSIWSGCRLSYADSFCVITS